MARTKAEQNAKVKKAQAMAEVEQTLKLRAKLTAQLKAGQGADADDEGAAPAEEGSDGEEDNADVGVEDAGQQHGGEEEQQQQLKLCISAPANDEQLLFSSNNVYLYTRTNEVRLLDDYQLMTQMPSSFSSLQQDGMTVAAVLNSDPRDLLTSVECDTPDLPIKLKSLDGESLLTPSQVWYVKPFADQVILVRVYVQFT